MRLKTLIVCCVLFANFNVYGSLGPAHLLCFESDDSGNQIAGQAIIVSQKTPNISVDESDIEAASDILKIKHDKYVGGPVPDEVQAEVMVFEVTHAALNAGAGTNEIKSYIHNLLSSTRPQKTYSNAILGRTNDDIYAGWNDYAENIIVPGEKPIRSQIIAQIVDSNFMNCKPFLEE